MNIDRNNIEWRPIIGFEDQYEVSNYGDFHILPYNFIDKAGRHIKRKLIAIHESIKDACIANKFSGNSYIGEVCSGKRKTYKNYIWKFI